MGVLKTMFATTGAIGAVAMIGYVCRPKSVATSKPPSASMEAANQEASQTDSNQASFREPLPLGSLFGCNNPAPPPVTFLLGRSPDEAEAPDLSTPAATVYSVLSLLDGAATGKLAPCLLEETDDPVSNLYPRYLGHPAGLVEVIDDEESAEVIWEATVHTAFSWQRRRWCPGEMITLTAKLVHIDGSWKLVRLHEGGEDGSQ